MTNLQSLIDRVERAEAGSRELDALVMEAVSESRDGKHGRVHRFGDRTWLEGFGREMMPPLTTSLDAALAFAEAKLPGWHVHNLSQRRAVKNWTVELWWWEKRIHGAAATPALALVLATLRAVAQRETGEVGA